MKKRTLLASVLLFTLNFSFSVLAQQRRHAVTLAPVFFRPAAFGIQPGYQFQFNEKWTLLAEAAFPLRRDYTEGDVNMKRFSLEGRFFPDWKGDK